MSHETTSQRWHIETDGHGWPTGLPTEEREPLIEMVKAALARFGAKGGSLVDIERQVTYAAERDFHKVPTFRRAALWDFRYACIERALRACDAEQRWHAKE